MATSTGVPAKEVPGEPVSMATRAMEATSTVMQKFGPIQNIGLHFCAFHPYADNKGRQVEAHHFCSHVTADFQQCLIYDSEQPKARLIGVEFVISEKLFLTLPEDEKKMWHSHEYEVKSGTLVLPEMPASAERPVVEEFVKTFGKTWHFWQYDRGDELPLGVPKLMGTIYKDGQLDPSLREAVEKRYGVSLEERARMRADLQGPECKANPLSEHMEKGRGYTLDLQDCELKDEPVKAHAGEHATPAAVAPAAGG